MSPMHLLDQLVLLEPIAGDDERDEAAFRHRQAIVESMGWAAGELERLVGILRVMPVMFAGDRFDVDVQGADTELAAVIFVLGEREEVVDAVAWRVGHPDRWTTYGRRAPALGWPQLLAHPTAEDAPSLRVLRTPLTWLRHGGDGIVPIDLPSTAHEIRAAIEAGGKVRFEDDMHAAEFAAAIRSLTSFDHLVVDDKAVAA